MKSLNQLSAWLNTILLWISGVFLVSMIGLTCANILLRTFRMPISGTFELVGFFGAVMTAFALGSTQHKRGHIAVDILVNTFPAAIKKIIQGVNYLLCLLFFGAATWQLAKKATILWKSGEVTETLKIIYYPFTYSVALGCVVLCLTFLTDLVSLCVISKPQRCKGAKV